MIAARAARAATLAIAIVLVAGCSGDYALPTPTPQDFGGIVTALAADGITASQPVSGDAGCSDPNLVAAAISFHAIGDGVTDPVLLRVYIFGSTDAYDRRRPDVDACDARWATDPATFETVDAAPYVVAGQGPWPDAFKAAIQDALRVAAGTASPNPS